MSHWYFEDGRPAYNEGKNGNATTLRDARRLLKEEIIIQPSVTTVGQVRHKEGLVYWKQQEAALMAAQIIQNDYGFDAESAASHEYSRQWTIEVIARAKEATTEKADIGTEIHDKLEKFHEDPFSVEGDDQKLCFAIVDCIKENTGLSLFDDFISEARFCDTHEGYAGMCDLHTKAHVKEPWVLDYKSKDEVTEKTRGWPEQAEQLEAYSHGLGIGGARVGNIFIDRNPPKDDEPWAVKFYEHKDPMAWERFKHTLYLWQVIKKFGPYFDRLMAEKD